MTHANFRIALLCFGFCLLSACSEYQGGPPRAAVIDGDSMAPHLVGQHHALECLECEMPFSIESVAPDFEATCPNCGYRQVKTSTATFTAANAVSLLPLSRAPKRWSVVGVGLADQKDAVVKRIAGMPGEQITIAGGDLFNQQGVLRKPWSVQKQMRIPVFDSSNQALPPYGNDRRFRASESSGWKVTDRPRFVETQNSGDIQWLDYVHWRNCRRNGERDEEFPIDDFYGFNQTTARGLFPVDDLHVELDLEFVELGSTFVLAFRRIREGLNDAPEQVFSLTKRETSIEIDYRGSKQRKPLQRSRAFKCDLPKLKLVFSSFDRVILLKLDGNTVLELRELESETRGPGDLSVFDPHCKQAFRIGGQSGSIAIDRLAIWRDVHFLDGPAGMEAKRKTLDAGSGYILLGDNSPRSLDSRVWPQAAVGGEQIIGTVVRE